MSSVFSRFLRSLDSAAALPRTEDFEKLLDSLRRVLVWKLKQRSLWSAPPAYLGVYGSSTWSDPGALDELLFDCYEFIFIDRRRGLQAQLEVVENVDGLVLRNVGNFLYELQKRHDPLGFRVFTVLKQATLSAIEGQKLYVLLGKPQIANDTILGFAPWSDPRSAESTDLGRTVKIWNDDLLPDLITADGKARARVLRRLEEHLCRLEKHGVESFRFSKLLDPLKADARYRWSTMWDFAAGDCAGGQAGDELRTPLRLARPQLDFEDRDAFHELLACVAKAIDRLDEPAKTRDYLNRLWAFLRQHAADSRPVDPALPASPSRDDRLLSRRAISRLLGIPRDRLPGLFATLQRLTAACRRPDSANASATR